MYKRRIVTLALMASFGKSIMTAFAAEALKCSDNSVVQNVESEVSAAGDVYFNSSLLSQLEILSDPSKRIKVAVTLSEFREYNWYDPILNKRYCEASSLMKIVNISERGKQVLVLNGLDLDILKKGIEDTIRYTVQLTSSGRSIVVVEY